MEHTLKIYLLALIKNASCFIEHQILMFSAYWISRRAIWFPSHLMRRADHSQKDSLKVLGESTPYIYISIYYM